MTNVEWEQLLEQYKLMWVAFTGELQRFWFRFNVLMSIQVAVAIGLVFRYDQLSKHKLVFGFSVCVIAIIAGLTCAIMGRALVVYETLIEVLKELEQRSAGRLYLMTAVIKASDSARFGGVERPLAMECARLMVVLMFVVWLLVLLLIWLNP